jgi:hypothetical protein
VRGIVVDLLGVHRADDGDVIGVLGDVRQDVGNFHPALSVAGKVVLGAHAGERLALELGELLALGERSGHRLAVEL